MLNDVHVPPLDPDSTPPKRGRTAGGKPSHGARAHRHDLHDRPHELERSAGHSAGVDLIYAEPEDRGDWFNTTLSAVVAGTVLLIFGVVAYTMLR